MSGTRASRRAHLALAACLALVPGLAAAQEIEIELSGRIDLGARIFFEDGLYFGQSEAGPHGFLGAEFSASAPVGPGRVDLQLAGLLDEQAGRTNAYVKQANYSQVFGNWDVLAGFTIENWGVADSRSILNWLNPRDRTDALLGDEPMGTPMLQANVATQVGTFSGYALLGFIEPTLPDRDSRHRALWATASDRAVFQEGSGRHADVALRYSNTFAVGDGSLDVAGAYFNGTDRTPVGLIGCRRSFGRITEAVCDRVNNAVVRAFEAGFPRPGASDRLWDLLDARATDRAIRALSAIPVIGFVPYYQKVQRGGVSAVYTTGDLQLRFEGAYREAKGEDGSFATVAGGSYTWSQVAGTDGTATLSMEYLWDDRDGRQPLTLFENDLFLGADYAFNDIRGTRVRLGGFLDLDSHAQLYQLSLSTRITDSLRAEISALHVEAYGWNDPLSFVEDDNFIELKISKFF